MKHNDILRKRNIELSQKVEELEKEIEDIQNNNKENVDIVYELMNEFHWCVKEYEKSLEILDKQKERYEKLMEEMIDLKSQMRKGMWDMVRYLLFNHIKTFFNKLFQKE